MSELERARRALARLSGTHRRAVWALVVVLAAVVLTARLVGARLAVPGVGLGEGAWQRVGLVELGLLFLVAAAALALAELGWRQTIDDVAGQWRSLFASRDEHAARLRQLEERHALLVGLTRGAAQSLRRTAGTATPAALVPALGAADELLLRALDLLEPAAGAATPFGLRGVLSRAVAASSTTAAVAVSVRDDVPEMVRGDGARLMRALSAAIDEVAAHAHGPVEVVASSRPGRAGVDVTIEVRPERAGVLGQGGVGPTDPGVPTRVVAALFQQIGAELDVAQRADGSRRITVRVPLGRRREDDNIATSDWEAVLDGRGSSLHTLPAATAQPAPTRTVSRRAAAGRPAATADLDSGPSTRTAAFFGGVAASRPAADSDDGEEVTVQIDPTQTINLADLEAVADSDASLVDVRTVEPDASGSGLLPMATRLVHTTTASPLVRPSRGSAPSARRVLVADEDAMTRWALTGQLSLLGYSVDAVASTAMTVDAFKLRRYDAVVLNTQMQGSDGFETVARLRALERAGAHTPCIALSARVDDDEQARCHAAGFDALVRKPVDPEQIARLVDRLSAATTAEPRAEAAAPARPVTGTSRLSAADASQSRRPKTLDTAPFRGIEALQAASDQPDLVRRMVDGFADRARSSFEAFDIGLHEQDSTLLRITADRLRRSCSALGLGGMEETSRRLGEAISAGDLDRAAGLVADLRREYGRVQPMLEQRA
ncbi:MAG: response regulator [Myxococcales bacterium]|nr:response regulator [Myxococcales bacterium]